MLVPIKDSILFVFADGVADGSYIDETTDWGFEIKGTHDDTGKRGRWGKIVSLGPDVDPHYITKAEYIYIEPLMWTTGFEHDGIKIWKTDATKVMATATAMVW